MVDMVARSEVGDEASSGVDASLERSKLNLRYSDERDVAVIDLRQHKSRHEPLSIVLVETMS